MAEDVSERRVRASLLVAGREVDPRTVGVRLGWVPGDAVTAQLLFGSGMLTHELREAGVDVSEDSLQAVVTADLAHHKDVAIGAYLNLVRHALFPEKPSHWWTFRRKAEAPSAIRWWWIATTRASREGDVLIIEGSVVAGSNI